MTTEKQRLKNIYNKQKLGAADRGIGFQLTFDEWLQIWENSGHLHERGCRNGQYCMSRYGDLGPYAVGNVFIQLQSENTRQGHAGKSPTDVTRQKIRQTLQGTKHSEATIEKRRQSNTGKKRSEEAKARMSQAQKKRFITNAGDALADKS